jgi:flagellar protein FliJ
MRSRESLLRLNRFRVEDCRRQVADMDLMIQDLMRKHDDLDNHVKFEENRTGTIQWRRNLCVVVATIY